MSPSPRTYLLATRPQFFSATILPALLGTAMAWRLELQFDLSRLLLTLLAIILYHGGVNVLNDYFDHKNQADELNTTPLTPFSGGSRMIQKGVLTPRETLVFGSALLALGTIVGLYLTIISGPFLLLLGIVGLLSGIFYSSPIPFLASLGLGEITVGLNLGLFTVAGAYYVQLGSLPHIPELIFAALPVTFLVSAILYINEFPDAPSDALAEKKRSS